MTATMALNCGVGPQKWTMDLFFSSHPNKFVKFVEETDVQIPKPTTESVQSVVGQM